MKTVRNWIAYRDDNPRGVPFYVEALPGHGGKDWGYTFDRKKALKLSKRDAQRFHAHMRYLGKSEHVATFSQ